MVVQDSAMSPQFNPGHTVYYQAGTKPKPGDFVVAEIEGEITLRKYRVTKRAGVEVPELVPLNPDFPEKDVDQVEILGVAVQQLIPLQ